MYKLSPDKNIVLGFLSQIYQGKMYWAFGMLPVTVSNTLKDCSNLTHQHFLYFPEPLKQF